MLVAFKAPTHADIIAMSEGNSFQSVIGIWTCAITYPLMANCANHIVLPGILFPAVPRDGEVKELQRA